MIKNLSFILAMIVTCFGCSKKTFDKIVIDNKEYVSVTSFGAKGDGKQDDRPAIQRAFESGKNIFVPDGTYLLASKTGSNGLLKITEVAYPGHILFDKDAILFVSANQPTDYIKPAVIQFQANKGVIKSIKIDGLRIDGNRSNHNIKNTGLVAYERKGAAIKELILNDIEIVNMGGGGIHTQARYNNFTNIRTKKCTGHGIGITNSTNPGIENEFYLDGYVSIDDDAYSIDFSGVKDMKNVGYAYPEYPWKGTAKNIKSVNCGKGMKTAGYWNLKLDNVIIESPKGNGFFINVDAPGKTIEINNMHITDAGSTGMQLGGETNLIAKNVKLEGCKVGMKISRTIADFDSLLIDSKNKSIASMRIASKKATISNFTIQNSSKKDEYPVWLVGENITLENGKFLNNNSPNEILVQKSAQNINLKGLFFSKANDTTNKRSVIKNYQTKGKIEVIDCDFSNVKGKQIIDKSKTLKIKGSKGLRRDN